MSGCFLYITKQLSIYSVRWNLNFYLVFVRILLSFSCFFSVFSCSCFHCNLFRNNNNNKKVRQQQQQQWHEIYAARKQSETKTRQGIHINLIWKYILNCTMYALYCFAYTQTEEKKKQKRKREMRVKWRENDRAASLILIKFKFYANA